MRIPMDLYRKALRRRYLDLRDEWQSDISQATAPQPDHPALLEMRTLRSIAVMHGWLDNIDEELPE